MVVGGNFCVDVEFFKRVDVGSFLSQYSTCMLVFKGLK